MYVFIEYKNFHSTGAPKTALVVSFVIACFCGVPFFRAFTWIYHSFTVSGKKIVFEPTSHNFRTPLAIVSKFFCVHMKPKHKQSPFVELMESMVENWKVSPHEIHSCYCFHRSSTPGTFAPAFTSYIWNEFLWLYNERCSSVRVLFMRKPCSSLQEGVK